MADNDGPVSQSIVNAIAVVVTMVWALSFGADLFVEEYEPPVAVHAAFMIVLGSIYGLQQLGGRKNDDK